MVATTLACSISVGGTRVRSGQTPRDPPGTRPSGSHACLRQTLHTLGYRVGPERFLERDLLLRHPASGILPVQGLPGDGCLQAQSGDRGEPHTSRTQTRAARPRRGGSGRRRCPGSAPARFAWRPSDRHRRRDMAASMRSRSDRRIEESPRPGGAGRARSGNGGRGGHAPWPHCRKYRAAAHWPGRRWHARPPAIPPSRPRQSTGGGNPRESRRGPASAGASR